MLEQIETDPVQEVPLAISADAAGSRQPRLLQSARTLIVVWAILLCWLGVSWAFHGSRQLAQDELNNLGWTPKVAYSVYVELFPDRLYNDRPTGFALERMLFDRFGFDYRPQLGCFLAFHFANCLLALVLFRRFGLRASIATALLGVFGVLWTSAQTATYLAASFDVLCTLFLLGSTLTVLSERRMLWVLSALLYLLALRSKEFGIVIPIFLTALLAHRAARKVPFSTLCRSVLQRLWPHYIILVAFSLRYLWLGRDIGAILPAGSDYHLDMHPGRVLNTMAYYTALVFAAEQRHPMLPCGMVLVIVAYALVRRRFMILFCVGAYLLTLLPVSLLPNIRSNFYVYGPQIFLLCAIGLFLQDLIESALRAASVRQWCLVCASLLILTLASAFRAGRYFVDGVHFAGMVRSTTATSIATMERQLSGAGHSAHFYVNHGHEIPWLFVYGDCAFPRMIRHSPEIQCRLRQPERELLATYAQDVGEKYFYNYLGDGTMRLRFAVLADGTQVRAPKIAEAGWIDDQSGLLEYKGTWRELRQFGQARSGTLTYTEQSGAEVTLSFRGTAVSYWFTRAYTHGMAEVWIDGKRRDVIDAYGPAIEWQSQAGYGGLTPGQHSITIRCLRSKSTASKSYDVDLDGFFVR